MGVIETDEDEYYTDSDNSIYDDYTDSDQDEDDYYEDDDEPTEEELISRRLLDLEWELYQFFTTNMGRFNRKLMVYTILINN